MAALRLAMPNLSSERLELWHGPVLAARERVCAQRHVMAQLIDFVEEKRRPR